MRGAFVIRLSAETQPDNNRFEGWAEEVDSGEEVQFRSAEELLRFLGDDLPFRPTLGWAAEDQPRQILSLYTTPPACGPIAKRVCGCLYAAGLWDSNTRNADKGLPHFRIKTT